MRCQTRARLTLHVIVQVPLCIVVYCEWQHLLGSGLLQTLRASTVLVSLCLWAKVLVSHIKVLSKFKALTCYTSFFTSFWTAQPTPRAFKKNMPYVLGGAVFVSIHTFTVSCCSISVMRGVQGGLTECSPQLNPDPPSTCIFSFSLSLQHVDSWSLISQSRWKSSWNYVSCRHFLKEWEGCTAHLHRNVILLVRALFKCVQCFFTAVFLAFSMWLYGISIVAPSLSVCLLWVVVVDIRVESAFLSRGCNSWSFSSIN